MFPRTALMILALLLIGIAAVLIRGAFVAQQGRCVAACNRGIAYPYQQLLTRMRELADAGRTDELRALIVRAQERSGEISQSCGDQSEESVYANQVQELTK